MQALFVNGSALPWPNAPEKQGLCEALLGLSHSTVPIAVSPAHSRALYCLVWGHWLVLHDVEPQSVTLSK